jgi:hypothetical protein
MHPLFLNLELDLTHLGVWVAPVIGLAAGGLMFAVGFAVASRRKGRLPVAPPVEDKETAERDPFLQGSQSERRAAVRREGSMVAVSISHADTPDQVDQGWVSDRSVGGLCLRLDAAVPLGTVLNVRPRDATAVVPWTPVSVKSCRHDGDAWEIGVQFVRTPPWSVLLLFG